MGTESEKLIATYKDLLSRKLARRALGTLSDEEESALAADQVEIWDRLNEDDRVKLEAWIDIAVNGRDWSVNISAERAELAHAPQAPERLTEEDRPVAIGDRLPPRKAAA